MADFLQFSSTVVYFLFMESFYFAWTLDNVYGQCWDFLTMSLFPRGLP